jgi:carboxypeptidase C (cathepsin A)
MQNAMVKKMYSVFLLFCLFCVSAISQDIKLPVDSAVITTHTVNIRGQVVNYTAKVGTQPVWNEQGEVIASLFYTYYERTGLKDRAARPIIFSFNGGPGSASVWMHIAYTGPKVLLIDDEGFPVQPYGVKDNPHSIIDIADIVFIDPVNTGYSRMVPGKDGKMPDTKIFFGVNEDVKYLAGWMTTFASRNNRWTSPKYIIGESYGGTRVMGLSLELQNSQWMYLNGVIMVSPADYKVLSQGGPVASSLNLPYYHATAWYHKKLAPELQRKDLDELLPDAENFAINELMPALAKGNMLSAVEKEAIAQKMSRFAGISQETILQHHLDVPESFFWKELLRSEGKTVGRLDSRYTGIDRVEAGASPDYNAELDSWLHSFTPAINYYLREELKFKTDLKYNMFGSVYPWDFENDNTRDNLRQAMAANPYLRVLFQSGYYDGATTYFNAKFTMWHVDPSGKMKDRFSFKGYRSGHMMYLRAEDLKKSNEDLREFILSTLSGGKSAKY